MEGDRKCRKAGHKRRGIKVKNSRFKGSGRYAWKRSDSDKNQEVTWGGCRNGE